MLPGADGPSEPAAGTRQIHLTYRSAGAAAGPRLKTFAHVGGYDDLAALARAGGLDALLRA